MNGPTLDSIRSLLRKSKISTAMAESPRIRLDPDDDHDDWVRAAVTYYKGTQFDRHSEVRISLRGQPAVDTGGVRRQFFSTIFERIASSDMYRIFEGPPDRLRPIFRMSNIDSGVMRTVGVMVAHSFVLDGQGFPYLSESCYYYLAGLVDKAITVVSPDDLSEQVRRLVAEVKFFDTDKKLQSFSRKDELLDLMVQSGCDLPLRVSL